MFTLDLFVIEDWIDRPAIRTERLWSVEIRHATNAVFVVELRRKRRRLSSILILFRCFAVPCEETLNGGLPAFWILRNIYRVRT